MNGSLGVMISLEAIISKILFLLWWSAINPLTIKVDFYFPSQTTRSTKSTKKVILPGHKRKKTKRCKKSGHTLSPKYSNSSFPEVLGGGGRLGSRSENVKIKIDIFKQK